ncbi:hypothetical protein ACQ4LE_005105 [Meloidogyne hapla]
MLIPNDPVFNYYNTTGTLYILTAKYSSIALLSFIAFLLNLFMVYTTLKNKCFHHRCNIYIGLNSFFTIPVNIGMSVKFFILLFGINFISLRTCYFFQAIPLLCASLATQTQFYIGVDRLLSIAFPVWYRFKDVYKSMILIGLFSIAKTIRTCWNVLSVAIQFPERPTMCASADLLQPEISQESLATVSIYNLLTVACYVTIWILMIIRKESSLTNRRLIKSLTAIIMINLAGYINTQVWLMLLPILSFNAVNIDSFVVVPALLMYVAACGSNMPILYAFSKDYNKAFRKTFKHLFCGKELATQTVSSTMQNRSNARNEIRMNVAKVNVTPVVNC